MRLTPQADRVLDTAGICMPQDSRPRSEEAVVNRRTIHLLAIFHNAAG